MRGEQRKNTANGQKAKRGFEQSIHDFDRILDSRLALNRPWRNRRWPIGGKRLSGLAKGHAREFAAPPSVNHCGPY
jgi:hypothetical protein